MQTLTSILKEHAMNDLDAQDRQALMKASRRLISGISLGALLGGQLVSEMAHPGWMLTPKPCDQVALLPV